MTFHDLRNRVERATKRDVEAVLDAIELVWFLGLLFLVASFLFT